MRLSEAIHDVPATPDVAYVQVPISRCTVLELHRGTRSPGATPIVLAAGRR